MRRMSLMGYILIIALMLMPAAVFADADEAAVEASAKYDDVAVNKLITKTNVLDLKAKSSVLMDAASGKILNEKNSHEKLPIASVTKVMSMLLVMEAVDSGKLSFDDRVSVSDYAAGMGGSQAYLEAGEEFTVTEMMKALAIHSSNDVTVALAEKVSGSEETFVADMNRKAAELGMKDTQFLDCTGLNDEGYSSAHDIALMSRELVMKHPTVLKFTGTWQDTFRNGTFKLDNTNKLIRFYANTDGLKTGFTNKAGFNLAATTNRNNLRLISVVLGEPDSNTRFAEARKLLDYGFANYERIGLDKKGELVGNITVKKGTKLQTTAAYGSDTSVLVAKGEKGKIEKEVKLVPELTAPITKDQKVGEIIYKIDGIEVGRYDLVAYESVNKITFSKLFTRLMVRWFSIGRA
ncbi:D-alanyl-D-alanine carboxypeptidase [Ruminiclostridium cellobioparum subsp. termitidis CT1112]|uniref:serine-type D-Ala-D-Ala carboxypeptidase n=2 Tax=Ruminiclostridium cellobioparum TaxID=29355 RepID=S0FSI9_RUMCE|nr:D-alanyl-D-alanine carboxypeptidase [Ruminiclostridium cellobioparum subsp. termitidis CT1112]